MDHWLSSYPLHLAQMPTDQRELEQHPLPVQTSAADSDGFHQTNASRPYHPCPPEETWAVPRSTLAPESLIAPHPGYSNPWATALEPYDIPPHLAHSLAPESTVFAHFPASPSNGASMITSPPSTMNHPSPTALKRRHSQDLVDWNTHPITSPWLGQAHSSYSQGKMETSGLSNSVTYGLSPSPPSPSLRSIRHLGLRRLEAVPVQLLLLRPRPWPWTALRHEPAWRTTARKNILRSFPTPTSSTRPS